MKQTLRKRSHNQLETEHASSKRPRLVGNDRLSQLSDELLLRVLSHLDVQQLLICQQLSQRLQRLACDAQLWKSAYYARWVRPKAVRLPGSRPGRLDVLSRTAAWLNERHLVAPGNSTNWQKQYKLRHNWSRGDAQLHQIRIAERQPTPRTLIQIHENVVLTADRAQGLRAWRLASSPKLQSVLCLQNELDVDVVPLAMAVSGIREEGSQVRCLIGFSDGTLSMFGLSEDGMNLVQLSNHRLDNGTGITALAFNYPHFASLTSNNTLHVCLFQEGREEDGARNLHVLSSLHSGSMWPPASLALRVGSTIIVSIAYAMPQYFSGWSVGVQEVQLSSDGALERTRIASSADQSFSALFSADSGQDSAIASQGEDLGRPVALSLNHPYILTAHADDTLSLFMLRTNHEQLEIDRPWKLWGHTSSISAVHVGARGKAVSVGVKGSEIRVWDLEGGLRQASASSPAAQASVQVRATIVDAEVRLRTADFATRPATGDVPGDQSANDAWVGFDEERLLILHEAAGGSEALMIYDFS